MTAVGGDRVVLALRTIRQGLEAGSILNVDFQDAKLTLDRAAERLFEGLTGSWWHGKGGNLDADKDASAALNALVWDVRVHYVRDAISAAKKLSKVSLVHPMVDSFRSAVAAILPVAELLEQAKAVVVKGRRPNPEAAARKAARLASVKAMTRGTCGCCFGGQAVLPSGKIHDHGYTFRRSWMKSGSCPGRAFRPLEISDEGPRWMVAQLTKVEAEAVSALETLPAAVSLVVIKRTGKPVELTEADGAAFHQAKATRKAELEADLRMIRSDLARVTEVVTTWKAEG